MYESIVFESNDGIILYEDEWGVLQGNFYGLNTEDQICREYFTNTEGF